MNTNPKQRKIITLGDHKDHKQLLVISIDHKSIFPHKQDPIDRIDMIAQV